MRKFIQQFDGQCDNCGAEIPKGQFIYIDGYEKLLCEDCGSEQAEIDELDLRGESESLDQITSRHEKFIK